MKLTVLRRYLRSSSSDTWSFRLGECSSIAGGSSQVEPKSKGSSSADPGLPGGAAEGPAYVGIVTFKWQLKCSEAPWICAKIVNQLAPRKLLALVSKLFFLECAHSAYRLMFFTVCSCAAHHSIQRHKGKGYDRTRERNNTPNCKKSKDTMPALSYPEYNCSGPQTLRTCRDGLLCSELSSRVFATSAE